MYVHLYSKLNNVFYIFCSNNLIFLLFFQKLEMTYNKFYQLFLQNLAKIFPVLRLFYFSIRQSTII